VASRLFHAKYLVVSWRGYRFSLFLDDPSYCLSHWYNDFASLHEFDTVSSKIVQTGDVVVDVGANYGYTATIFSRYVGERGKVVAVEAAPHTASRLRKQIELSGSLQNVVIVQAAVGAREGVGRMRVSLSGRQDCQYVAYGDEVILDAREYLDTEIYVPIKTLDQALDQIGVSEPVMVKIDVEGFEGEVLDGAQAILGNQNPPWLLVEILGFHKQMREQSSYKLLQKLYAYSEFLYVHDSGTFHIVTRWGLGDVLNSRAFINVLVRPPRGKFTARRPL
jgi:FkbM family methyltransferase